VTIPAKPTRGCDIFDGWYTDEDLTIPYDFSTPVTSDLELYAKWIEQSCPGPDPGPGPDPSPDSRLTIVFTDGNEAIASELIWEGEL